MTIYHDGIRNELMEKLEKIQLCKLYTDRLTAPSEEEHEAAKAEYLQMVGNHRVNTVVNIYG